jgi:hypothetical protein
MRVWVLWYLKSSCPGTSANIVVHASMSYNTNLFKTERSINYPCLRPLYLSNNGDTLILANDEDDEAFIYNRIDNRVEKQRISNNILWSEAKDYVESLVSIEWKWVSIQYITCYNLCYFVVLLLGIL